MDLLVEAIVIELECLLSSRGGVGQLSGCLPAVVASWFLRWTFAALQFLLARIMSRREASNANDQSRSATLGFVALEHHPILVEPGAFKNLAEARSLLGSRLGLLEVLTWNPIALLSISIALRILSSLTWRSWYTELVVNIRMFAICRTWTWFLMLGFTLFLIKYNLLHLPCPINRKRLDFISYKLHNSFNRFALELIKSFIDFIFHEICGFNILFIDAAFLKLLNCYQTLSTFGFDLINQYSIRFLRALQLLNLIFLSYQYLNIFSIFSSKLTYLSFSFFTLNIYTI